MEDLLQFLMTGLTIGSIYAIVALGFVTVYSVTKVINLSQGEFVMLGGMTMFSMLSLGVPYFIAFILTIGIVVISGYLLEFIIIRRAKRADAISLIILTIGASIFIRGIARIVWGKNPVKVESFLNSEPINIFGAAITPQSIFIMLILFICLTILYYIMERTMVGKAFRACSANPLAARLMSISPAKMSSFSFIMSATLGAVAGLAIAPIIFPTYDMGGMLGVKGFSATILGGLGSAQGAVIGGIMIGLIESLGAGYVSSGIKDAIVFGFILLILLIRPYGIMGEKNVGKGGL
ncbi:branched-chain amino acid ABC transporter permease [Bacillus aquiflavi]|uniref:Branched-chain amino acid ABC transporter permease n=1 Tax=Bacillus aquiflavi TaxID=2672567 RepID=A0A6B3W2K8_9BACI|nr:branched-chain amino acid ABC transporter permease [Bacillus aquiflavi]MBA4537508.1 branched-chain amino acid ABC transporter permease [Bacillus aquiflavi]NEY81764.1 branched-chain amino acid ABC transporter permease [Bacillus aquiflavi]UAC47471.1 branched-chain amino acid ABC transporter permease [Bacillus aquiflavi]